MISIAEYFVMHKDFPKDSFDIATHRSRIAFSFYSYGMAKQIYGYESEPEYLDHGDGDGEVQAKRSSPKKTRAGRVQTRKRKMTKATKKQEGNQGIGITDSIKLD